MSVKEPVVTPSPATDAPPTPAVYMEGEKVCAVSPEGKSAQMSIADLVQKMAPPRFDTGDVVLPDGVKCVLSTRGGVVVVHQTPPRIHNFKWIANDSDAEYGPGTEYRSVRVALPYVVLLAVFREGGGGTLGLAEWNECYFRNEPIKSLDDELLYPALLNVSKFESQESTPLAWVCTQHLRPPHLDPSDQPARYFVEQLRGLLHHLLETGFNHSSEHHELCSWFTATMEAGVDERLRSIETWEEATRKDPNFATEVAWLPTGYSVKKMAERIFDVTIHRRPPIKTATDVSRLVFRRELAARRRRRHLVLDHGTVLQPNPSTDDAATPGTDADDGPVLPLFLNGTPPETTEGGSDG